MITLTQVLTPPCVRSALVFSSKIQTIFYVDYDMQLSFLGCSCYILTPLYSWSVWVLSEWGQTHHQWAAGYTVTKAKSYTAHTQLLYDFSETKMH